VEFDVTSQRFRLKDEHVMQGLFVGVLGGQGFSEHLLGFVFGVILCFLGVHHHEKPPFGRRLVVSFQASRFTTGLNIQTTQEL